MLKNFVRKYLTKKDIKLLEIGCGTGEYTKKVAEKLPQADISALDISKNIVQLAKKKCKGCKNVSFKVGSAYNTGYKDSSFDVIFGFYVLHHLEIPKFRKEMDRVLKPGGIIFFYEPNILNPIVFLIKSNKILKRMVGDSPYEWAINPLKIREYFPSLKIEEIFQSEFVWPMSFISTGVLKFLDRATSSLSYVPIIKYLGGSVAVLARKI